jgi:hypothetical protein
MDESRVALIVANHAWSEESAWLCLWAGFECDYCDLDFLSSAEAYRQIQFDHIEPRHAGGPDTRDNYAAACRTCNVDRKSRWNTGDVGREKTDRSALVAACRRRVKERCDLTMGEVTRPLGILDRSRAIGADSSPTAQALEFAA